MTTDDSRPTRKQRRRAQLRARHAAQKAEREAEAQATSAQGSGDSSEPQRPILESIKDLPIWSETNRHPEFVLRPSVFSRVGADLEAMLDDPNLTPAERIRVIGELRKLHQSNSSRQSFEFSVHRHYESRHSHAKTPEADADEEPVEVVGYAKGFTMAVDDEEVVDVMEEAQNLGIMHLLLGKST